jgi:uncharacterized protein YegJ (DUF2314 family)
MAIVASVGTSICTLKLLYWRWVYDLLASRHHSSEGLFVFGMGGVHTCGDCRLACIDCNGQICPKCMVQCPVGNRCPKCAGRFTSHLLVVTPWIVIRTVAAAAVIGYAFGFLQMSSMGFYGFFIMYAVGLLVGNVLHRVAGFKMGPKIIATVIAGVICGAALSPMFQTSARPKAIYSTAINPAVVDRMTTGTVAGGSGLGVAASRADGSLRAELLEVAAKQKCQQQWTTFENAFQAKAGSNFRIKVPVKEDVSAESVWLDVTGIKSDEVSGKVISDPARLKNLKQGDNLNVQKKDVQDWVYFNGELYAGGFTIPREVSPYAMAAMGDPYANSSFGMGGVINLIIFLLGILTPITGIVPPIRMPFSRY